MCWTQIRSKLTEATHCGRKIPWSPNHDLHEAVYAIAVQNVFHGLFMTASFFTHALAQLKSGILQCLDGIAAFHSKLLQHVCGKLGLASEHTATGDILIDLHS